MQNTKWVALYFAIVNYGRIAVPLLPDFSLVEMFLNKKGLEETHEYTLIEIFSIFMYHNIFIHMRYNSILRIKIALIIN